MPQLNAFEQQCLNFINSCYPYRLTAKKFFFEACLFMEGQKPAIKNAIAEHYARQLLYHIVRTMVPFNTKTDQNLINLTKLIKENILLNEKELSNFKSVIITLESHGHPDCVDYCYRDLRKTIRALPPSINYNMDIHNHNIISLKQTVKTSVKKQPYLIFSARNLFIMFAFISGSLEYINENKTMFNVSISLLFALFCRIAESNIMVSQFYNLFDQALTLSLEYIPTVSTDNKNRTTLTKTVPHKSTPHCSTPSAVSNTNVFTESYRMTVFVTPSFLVAENERESKVVHAALPKRWHLWSSVDKIQEKKQEHDTILAPDYFGPAFNDTVMEDFVKLEGRSLGSQSHLYGIWYQVDKEGDARPLYAKFKNGTLVEPAHSKGIKQFTFNGEKYYEIKDNNTARIFGKKFITIDNKTAVVFVHYDKDGLHKGSNVNERIIQQVDTKIENLKNINSTCNQGAIEFVT